MSSHRIDYLESEHSPYIRRSVGSAVRWYPWGKKALEEAQKAQRPILLVIGSSHSHWCRLMDENTFENPSVAELLNEAFVCIKVDRQERPDVAKAFMTYRTYVIYPYKETLEADKPLSFILSPDLVPLINGTYFRPSNLEVVLRKVKRTWDKVSEGLIECGMDDDHKERGRADFIESRVFALNNCLKRLPQYGHQKRLPKNALYQCAKKLASTYNEAFGGLGSESKFPRPVEIQLMLYQLKTLKDAGKPGEADEVLEMVAFTLKSMAMWSIHDHIGGGFHRIGRRFCNNIVGDGFKRYNVVQCSPVPNFEKMLYDQGQLATVYLDAFSLTKDPFYSYVCRDILDFVRREMKGQDGQFFSALDGDSDESESGVKRGEGAFYQWTISEIEDVLGTEATLFKDAYNIRPLRKMCDEDDNDDEDDDKNADNDDDFERKYSPAIGASGVSVSHPTLGICRQKLFKARLHRRSPYLDETVIVSWNGLMISSLARASKILKDEPGANFNFPVSGCDPEEYMEDAVKAASFIKKHLYNEQERRLSHSFWEGPSEAPGILVDYAFLISGLLDLYEFGGGTEWLKWAIDLQEIQDELFLDKEGGGYYYCRTTEDDIAVLRQLCVKEDRDGAEPSGNSVSLMNLTRLASMMSFNAYSSYMQRAKRLLEAFGTRLKDRPEEMPLMCCAAEMLTVGLQLVSPRASQIATYQPGRKVFRRLVLLVCDKLKSRVEFNNMLAATHSSYDPNTRVIHMDYTDVGYWIDKNETAAERTWVQLRYNSDEVFAFVFEYAAEEEVGLSSATDPSLLRAKLLERRDQLVVALGESEHWKPRMKPPPEEAASGPACLCVISFYKSAVGEYRSCLNKIADDTGAGIEIASEGTNIVITGKPIQIQQAASMVEKLVDKIPARFKVREPSVYPPRTRQILQDYYYCPCYPTNDCTVTN